MPWVQIQKSTQAKWSDYEAVQNALGDDGPAGLLYHVAGEIDGGHWQSVSVWESEADFHRFREEKLMPAVMQALPGMADEGPPPSETFEAKHVYAA